MSAGADGKSEIFNFVVAACLAAFNAFGLHQPVVCRRTPQPKAIHNAQRTHGDAAQPRQGSSNRNFFLAACIQANRILTTKYLNINYKC